MILFYEYKVGTDAMNIIMVWVRWCTEKIFIWDNLYLISC